MKKMIFAVTAIFLAVVLAAWGGAPADTAAPTHEATEAATPEPTEAATPLTEEEQAVVDAINAAAGSLTEINAYDYGITISLPESSTVSDTESGAMFKMADRTYMVLNSDIMSDVTEETLNGSDDIINTFIENDPSEAGPASTIDVAGKKGREYTGTEQTEDGVSVHRVVMFMTGDSLVHLRFVYPEFAGEAGSALSGAIVDSISLIGGAPSEDAAAAPLRRRQAPRRATRKRYSTNGRRTCTLRRSKTWTAP